MTVAAGPGTVVVTGGGGGLGQAVTARFRADGWRVVVPWVAPAEQERLGAVEELVLVEADLSDPVGVARVMEAATADPERPLMALAHLVGGFAEGGRVDATPVEDFERQHALNLRTTYLVCQAALPHLVAAGGGAIVCVSTRAAVRPFSGASGYITSKAALLSLVDVIALEYRNDRVRANAVLPSVIDTPGNRAAQPDADPSRWVAPESLAGVIAFLCSDAARDVSGAHVPVYGLA